MKRKLMRNEFKQSVDCKYSRHKRVNALFFNLSIEPHHYYCWNSKRNWKNKKIKKQYMKNL